MLTPPVNVTAVAWQVFASERDARCAQCRRVLYEGELVAQHPMTGLRFHPYCAGVISCGSVVAAPMFTVRPSPGAAA
jgi:hypothetical protein